MKRYFSSLLSLFSYCLLLTSCTTATPEKYFEVAVLNSNMLVGFAGDGQLRELEASSMKMGKTKDEFAPMQRKEVVSSKISFVEETLKKVKSLQETADTKDIRQASLALYEFVLPVYKNEYMNVANLYDAGASKEKIQTAVQAINAAYIAKFDALYNKLIGSGKLYAAKHSINVNWNL